MPVLSNYRAGAVVPAPEDPVQLIDDIRAHEDSFGWIALGIGEASELRRLAEALDLHALAVEDALSKHERPKVARFETHRLLTLAGSNTDANGIVHLERLTAFILDRLLITVHEADFPMDEVHDRIAENVDLADAGVPFLIWGILDVVVDDHINTLEELDNIVEGLAIDLFDSRVNTVTIQERAFALRRSVMRMQHVTMPLREVVTTVLRRSNNVAASLEPYFADVYDHTIHAGEWSEGLRDQISSLIETNLALQGNRMNLIMKKVTSWAAVIAVPTFITGYFGQNVGFPGINTGWAWLVSIGVIVVSSLALYWTFRRKDWL